jgi:hypothetical protein
MPSTNATTTGATSAAKETARENEQQPPVEEKQTLPKEKVMITGDDVLIEYVDRIIKLLKLSVKEDQLNDH